MNYEITWALMKIVLNHIIMKNNYFKKYQAEKCQTSLRSNVSLYVIIHSSLAVVDIKTKECIE